MNDGTAIQFQVEPPWSDLVDQGRLRDAARATLDAEGLAAGAEMSVVVVGDEEMVRLNQSFRGGDYSTDVLTFPFEDEGPDDEMAAYLGDIILCYEQAQRQAEEEGHSVGEELVLLTVHGTLHLLGYDDESDETRAEMWERQQAILAALGLAQIAPR